MIEFKKYSSIENSFNREFLEYVVAQMPADLQYVVQEKVHGANTSFLCDGQDVKFAKRTSALAEDEKFYEYPELLESYKERVLNLFVHIKSLYPAVKQISAFGEMFGGAYPHPDIKPMHRYMTIQKGVFYTPKHESYGFDIYLFTEDTNFFLPVEEVNSLFEAEGFFYARTLFQGTLVECLKYPNAFQSKISEWLGYPSIEDNICEGVVIRPVTPMYLRNGDRVLIKNKNERFAEKKSIRKHNKMLAAPIEQSPELISLIDEISQFVTENRLANVVSHIGEVHVPKDFGKIMGLFAKDALEDFMKEYSEDYLNLEKTEQKMLNKALNQMTTELVKKEYMNQAYISDIL